MAGAPNIDPQATSPETLQILSARQALRVLDTAIARTESRLRALPSQVPSGGGGAGTSPRGGSVGVGGSKRGLIEMKRGGIEAGPVQIGKQGIGLNGGFLRAGGRLVSTMVGFHIGAGIGNQIMDSAEQYREILRQGGTEAEARKQFGLSAARGVAETVGNVSGASPLTKMLLRAGGFSSEGAEQAFKDTMDEIFTSREGIARKKALRAQAIAKAGASVRKQYSEAYEFLDAWTPDDFDVANDLDRKDLGIEMRRINQGRLEAWMDDAQNSATRKAARDASGD